MMNQLFAECDIPMSERDKPNLTQAYGELVLKTLEVWMELKGWNASFDEVVSAFEKAQKEIK
jgi:hypothetical protein